VRVVKRVGRRKRDKNAEHSIEGVPVSLRPPSNNAVRGSNTSAVWAYHTMISIGRPTEQARLRALGEKGRTNNSFRSESGKDLHVFGEGNDNEKSLKTDGNAARIKRSKKEEGRAGRLVAPREIKKNVYWEGSHPMK